MNRKTYLQPYDEHCNQMFKLQKHNSNTKSFKYTKINQIMYRIRSQIYSKNKRKNYKMKEEINSLRKAANMNKLSTATQKEDRKKPLCNSVTDPAC